MYVKGTVSPMPGFAGLRGRGLGRLRGRVRVLGCSSCSAKKLGQEFLDLRHPVWGRKYRSIRHRSVVCFAGGAFGSFAPPTRLRRRRFTISTG